MDHKDHVNLLRNGITNAGGVWADFGSGQGAFTLALAELGWANSFLGNQVEAEKAKQAIVEAEEAEKEAFAKLDKAEQKLAVAESSLGQVQIMIEESRRAE